MSKVATRYAQVSDAFATKIAGVPAGRWDAPSPCEGWNALDVVRHVIETHGQFLGFVGRELRPIPPIQEDPAGAFDIVRQQMLADLEHPERAKETYKGYFGTKPFEWGVDTFLSFDLVVHGWDLAHATGQDETIDPAELERILADAEGWGDTARAPGVFGPPVDAPEGADQQTRVLAFLGRRAAAR